MLLMEGTLSTCCTSENKEGMFEIEHSVCGSILQLFITVLP